MLIFFFFLISCGMTMSQIPNLEEPQEAGVCENKTFLVTCNIDCSFRRVQLLLPNGNYYGTCYHTKTCQNNATVKNNSYQAYLKMSYLEFIGEKIACKIVCMDGETRKHSLILVPCKSDFEITSCKNNMTWDVTITGKDINYVPELTVGVTNTSTFILQCSPKLLSCATHGVETEVNGTTIHIFIPINNDVQFITCNIGGQSWNLKLTDAKESAIHGAESNNCTKSTCGTSMIQLNYVTLIICLICITVRRWSERSI